MHQWAIALGYTFRRLAWPPGQRLKSLRRKLPAVRDVLRTGRDCLWLDADALPVLSAPSPAAKLPAAINFAAILLPPQRPVTGYLATGIYYARAAALETLERAVYHQDRHSSLFVDQRALRAAIEGWPTVPSRESPPSPQFPVLPLCRSWFGHVELTGDPGIPVYLWHASVKSHERASTLRGWIAQGRHKHNHTKPLPAAWFA